MMRRGQHTLPPGRPCREHVVLKQNVREQYLRRRSLVALAGLALIAFPWLVGEAMIPGTEDAQRTHWEAVMGGGIVTGILYIVVGNVMLYVGYRRKVSSE